MSTFKINKKPAKNELRLFGIVFALFATFIPFFFINHSRDQKTLITCFGIGAILLIISLIFPRLYKWVYIILNYITYPIGIVISILFFAILYYGVFVFVGALLRTTNRKIFIKSPISNQRSFWTLHITRTDKNQYFRQF